MSSQKENHVMQDEAGTRFQKIGSLVITGALGGLLAFLTLALFRPTILLPADMERGYSSPQPVGEIDGNLRSLRVKRADDLSFRLVARINGRPLPMLIDTGANITVLSKSDAAAVGIPEGPATDVIRVVGINSRTSNYRRVGLYPIAIGPIGLVGVPIAVDDSGELPNSILGQDAICGIDRITIENDEIEFMHGRKIAQGCTDFMIRVVRDDELIESE